MNVAPFTGAWIEICLSLTATGMTGVAPFTGAWIEISEDDLEDRLSMSLPSRERGLKLLRPAPLGDAGGSLPSRERGLKLHDTHGPDMTWWSLPSRERGLKLRYLGRSWVWFLVAPFTGAWIEILVLHCGQR